jgi:amino acid adenylation domain-containing protein
MMRRSNPTALPAAQNQSQTEHDNLYPLETGFLRSAELFPHRPALEVGGQTHTYEELLQQAASLAATLQQHAPTEPRFTAIYAYRSAVAYAGILAALLRGHSYVPLNPLFPAVRTQLFLERTSCQAMIVDEEGEKTLDNVLKGTRLTLVILMPSSANAKAFAKKWPQHTFLGPNDVVRSSAWKKPAVGLDDIAYVSFTSGSSGEPKGVTISHRNVAHYTRTMAQRYDINEQDRISQFSELTFDASVFDIFCAWKRGACVVCPALKTLLNPVAFLSGGGITIFHSAPSSGFFLKRLGALTSNRFPKMRASLFGGEMLPVDLAQAWQSAAPNSVVENRYGPTELTVTATAYRWDAKDSPGECHNGTVPIGDLLPGVEGLVVDENLQPVSPGEKGEFVLGGPQRMPGYLNDPERTARALVLPPSRNETYYRTGDIVCQMLGKTFYVFLGRKDHQVKIFGMRIELGEVEAALRDETGVMQVAALAWPPPQAGVGGIAAFIGSLDVDPERVRAGLRNRLPQQMVPKQIRVIEQLPLNNNGKVDRRALQAILEGV